ncbi:hypothetical protein JF66_07930 [Cryobacterium sp. MLB-32]|uniref:hypothetical protein n=1 Tax=Cryobacterium sp. MLB-32 TaxID=1529318 RepID=UPI0004E613AD|nr:hypothetical protein [Cryobacterium sp. MLB-32]KFF59915.1 hypothetical protein JF66_07930 [Cryobacterium sp. MLB-32]
MNKLVHKKTASIILALFAVAVAVFGVSAPAYAATTISHASATSQLSAAGITWSSSGNCATRSNSTCTSFEQVNQESISGVITLKNASGCAINVTGGTEVGHASGTYSHYNGYKLDVSDYACISSYITNTFTYTGLRGDGYPQYQSGAGNLYADEGSHWDITFYNCGGC